MFASDKRLLGQHPITLGYYVWFLSQLLEEYNQPPNLGSQSPPLPLSRKVSQRGEGSEFFFFDLSCDRSNGFLFFFLELSSSTACPFSFLPFILHCRESFLMVSSLSPREAWSRWRLLINVQIVSFFPGAQGYTGTFFSFSLFVSLSLSEFATSTQAQRVPMDPEQGFFFFPSVVFLFFVFLPLQF